MLSQPLLVQKKKKKKKREREREEERKRGESERGVKRHQVVSGSRATQMNE